MITRAQLDELRKEWEIADGLQSEVATWANRHGADLLDTIDALYKQVKDLEDSVRLQKGHMLHVAFTDCPECVAFQQRILKLEAVAEAAKILNDREPKIASICGIAKALAALKQPGKCDELRHQMGYEKCPNCPDEQPGKETPQ